MKLTPKPPSPKPMCLAKPRRKPLSAAPQPPVAAHPAPEADAPNATPVELGAVEAPKTADGKIDAAKVADPADFGDWDEQGCRGKPPRKTRRIFVFTRQRCAFLFPKNTARPLYNFTAQKYNTNR